MSKWCHNGLVVNITVKDVPPELHERLRRAADETGRSLNKMILYTLEHALAPRRVRRAELLRRIRRRRDAMGSCLDDDALRAAIREGRR